MLLNETGKSLIQHTYDQALQARLPARVCVATDSLEIQAVVQRFGGNVVMTHKDAHSGTDRVAELAAQLDYDLFVNVQGDEPEIAPGYIDRLIECLTRSSEVPMATLASPIYERRKLHDPNCVKVAVGQTGHALYFSRSVIPNAERGVESSEASGPVHFQHLGVYAYRRQFLLDLPSTPSPLEKLERLEQLRALEAGYSIAVDVVPDAPNGVDSLDDYHEFVIRYLSDLQSRQDAHSAATR